MTIKITNEISLQALKHLKQTYADLPWYQRIWFSLWSFSLWRALSAIDLANPTEEQVQHVYRCSEAAWFFNSIFGLLTQFRVLIKSIEAIEIGKPNLSSMPPDIKQRIIGGLKVEDIKTLASTCRYESLWFKPMVGTGKFLLEVVHGEYDKVEARLKKNSDLFLQKGQVTDYSGRTFYNISGFQYYLWALDKHGWTRMLKSLPLDEEGARIKGALLQQYQELKEKGVAYELNGKIIREEHHFDFKNTIIQALQTQVNYQNQNKPWDEIDKQWCTGVGSAQKLLPVHVVYEYCGDVSLDPLPQFIKQPTTLTMKFYNWITERYENWFSGDSKLGVNFAIYRPGGWWGARRGGRARGTAGWLWGAAIYWPYRPYME